MTLKNLLCVAVATALMTSSAAAQVTSGNATGPTISIDLLRNGFGNPIVDPSTGGLTYVVSVTPDSSQPVYGGGAGPLGTGAAVALELGLTVGGAGIAPGGISGLLPTGAGDVVTVNLDSTPGTGDSSTDDGVVEFANPGNPIFGFEALNIDTSDPLDGVFDQAGGVQISGNDIFAALGTTFFTTADSQSGLGPYEVLYIKTAALDVDVAASLTPSLSLNGSSIAGQATDLSGPTPLAEDFALSAVVDSDTILGGDTDLDGDIDIDDLNVFGGGAFGSTGVSGGFSVGDFDFDGDIDIDDLNQFGGGAFGTTGTAPAVAGAAVPEPNSVALLLAGFAAACGLTARRQ